MIAKDLIRKANERLFQTITSWMSKERRYGIMLESTHGKGIKLCYQETKEIKWVRDLLRFVLIDVNYIIQSVKILPKEALLHLIFQESQLIRDPRNI